MLLMFQKSCNIGANIKYSSVIIHKMALWCFFFHGTIFIIDLNTQGIYNIFITKVRDQLITLQERLQESHIEIVL